MPCKFCIACASTVDVTYCSCGAGPFCPEHLAKHSCSYNELVLPVEEEEEEEEERVSRKSFRGPLIWMGNKFESLDQILPYLPYRDSYIEPFGGSMQVLLNRKSSKLEVYNDQNSGLVCFYRVVRSRQDELVERLKQTCYAREEWEWCYTTWKEEPDELERAAKWYYMVRCSMLGQGRHWARSTTRSTEAMRIWNKMPEFAPLAERIIDLQIENLDFRQILKDYDHPGAVFYLDPPYVETRLTRYKECTMSPADHSEMIKCIKGMQGFVALSGYANEIYDSEIFWTQRFDWQRRDRINTPKANRDMAKVPGDPIREVLWIKEAS